MDEHLLQTEKYQGLSWIRAGRAGCSSGHLDLMIYTTRAKVTTTIAINSV